MTITEGQELLIIFDGWDELSIDLRQSSLAARIIRREVLAKCSVIVTSRSYASYSLLKLCSVNRHVEVLGFSEREIRAVVKEHHKRSCMQLRDLSKILKYKMMCSHCVMYHYSVP